MWKHLPTTANVIVYPTTKEKKGLEDEYSFELNLTWGRSRYLTLIDARVQFLGEKYLK